MKLRAVLPSVAVPAFIASRAGKGARYQVIKDLRLSLMTAILVLFTSCEKEEHGINNLQNTKIKLDSFIENVMSENAKTEDEIVFYIDYELNTKDRTIKINKVVEKELDFFLIEEKLSEEEIASEKYQITCTKAGEDLWIRKGDKFSFGTLLYDCLEPRCTDICQQRMVYVPANNSFILIN